MFFKTNLRTHTLRKTLRWFHPCSDLKCVGNVWDITKSLNLILSPLWISFLISPNPHTCTPTHSFQSFMCIYMYIHFSSNMQGKKTIKQSKPHQMMQVYVYTLCTEATFAQCSPEQLKPQSARERLCCTLLMRAKSPKTAVQGLHLLSFGTAELIFHVHNYIDWLACHTHYITVVLPVLQCVVFLYEITERHSHMELVGVGVGPWLLQSQYCITAKLEILLRENVHIIIVNLGECAVSHQV